MSHRVRPDREAGPGLPAKQERLKVLDGEVGEEWEPVLLSLIRREGRGEGMPRRKVLLVHRDPHVLDEVGGHLMAWGLSVRCEATTEGCWAVLRQEMPDLLLLDLHLPGGNGLEALRTIRASHPDLLVLIIGASMPGAEEASLRRGAKGFLSWPFRMEDLKAQVFQAMGERGDEGR